MGFGTLFFGCFLLLNITYFYFTDLICALIIAISLNKLSSVNRFFKGGFYTSLFFALVGAAELFLQIYVTFTPNFELTEIAGYIAIMRYISIAVTTAFILLGIENVAYEVGLDALAKKARRNLIISFTVYAVATLLEIPMLEALIDIKILVKISVFTLLAVIITVALNLFTVYSAYSKICMPGDVNNDVSDKPSRFEFVNKFREHSAEKQKEYAEYKLEKLKKKNQKKNEKKK